MVMVAVPTEPVLIKPVGVVVSDFKRVSKTYDYQKESLLYMREDLTDALSGLEYFSHLHVIYSQNRRQDWLRLIEWEGEEPPLTLPVACEPAIQGVYSTRSPSRPSAMGSCVVELVRREENRLYVKGLDAIDGTPVLDIKIYIPQYDAFPLAEAPLNWCMGNELITTSRHLHWDTINVGLTLGLRIGTKALQVLGISRREAVKAEVVGGHFFAQGVEGATGCSVLQGNLSFTGNNQSLKQWKLKLAGQDSTVEISLKDRAYSEAAEVLEADDQTLFASVEKSQTQFSEPER